MNFEFMGECRMELPGLQRMYDEIHEELEAGERLFWRDPRRCGIILRGTAEKICRVYNIYYEIEWPEDTLLEQFLCYQDDEGHNAMVSRFLSCVRKEQRDRLNRLRVLGDDCILGEAAPDQGMAFDDRMEQNARRMMETMMEVLKDMCRRINKRDDVSGESFRMERLPETREEAMRALGKVPDKESGKKKSLFGRIFG